MANVSGSSSNGGSSNGSSNNAGSNNSGSGGSTSAGSANGGSSGGGDPAWGDECVDERLPGLAWDGSSDPHQECVDRVNAFRAELGLSPLERWTAGESCADATAQAARDTGDPHPPAPDECDGLGGGAQNSCPGYSSVGQTLELCMAQMWCEGPSPSGEWEAAHGHHMNMAGDAERVACGIFVDEQDDGRTWLIQNFQ